eukprot:6443968-Amphidinium_carterae.2
MTDPQGSRVILTTTNGIPQGDPLSSLAFACLLHSTTKTFLPGWQKGFCQKRVVAGMNVTAASAGADVDICLKTQVRSRHYLMPQVRPHFSPLWRIQLLMTHSPQARHQDCHKPQVRLWHLAQINEAAHMRMHACPGIAILAYADDIILVLHPDIATDAWELWKRTLSTHNLKVQPEKTHF